MFIFISVLIFIVAILLIFVILVQNPKGGLASNFSSSNQVMGVRKTTDFLRESNLVILGIALIILSVISSSLIGGNEVVTTNESEIAGEAQQVIPQSQAPVIQEGVPSGQASDDAALPMGDEQTNEDSE